MILSLPGALATRLTDHRSGHDSIRENQEIGRDGGDAGPRKNDTRKIEWIDPANLDLLSTSDPALP